MKRLIPVLLFALLLIMSVGTAADEIKVKTSGGTQKISATGKGELLYYSLSALKAITGGTIDWTHPGYSVRFVLDNNQFLFTVGSPYINLNDSVYNILLPAKLFMVNYSSLREHSLPF